MQRASKCTADFSGTGFQPVRERIGRRNITLSVSLTRVENPCHYNHQFGRAGDSQGRGATCSPARRRCRRSRSWPISSMIRRERCSISRTSSIVACSEFMRCVEQARCRDAQRKRPLQQRCSGRRKFSTPAIRYSSMSQTGKAPRCWNRHSIACCPLVSLRRFASRVRLVPIFF